MPRPTAAQLVYGSCTVIFSTLVMLLYPFSLKLNAPLSDILPLSVHGRPRCSSEKMLQAHDGSTNVDSTVSRCLRFFHASLRYVVSASYLFEAGLSSNTAYFQRELCGRHESTITSGWSSITSIIVSFCFESNRDRGGVEGTEMATYEYQSAAAILQDQPR